MTEKLSVSEFRRRHLGKKVRTSANAKKDPAVVRLEAKLLLVQLLLDRGHHIRLEHRFHPERMWRFDLALTDARIALELDGGGWVQGAHHRARGRKNDNEKDAAAQALGWRVLRVDYDEIPDVALERVSALLRTEGG